MGLDRFANTRNGFRDGQKARLTLARSGRAAEGEAEEGVATAVA